MGRLLGAIPSTRRLTFTQVKDAHPWDVATGQEMKKLSGLFSPPGRVAFAGGDKRAVAATLGAGFHSWDLETEKVVRQMNYGQHRTDALSADGEQVFLPRTNNWVEAVKTRESGGGTRAITGKWETVAAATFALDGHSVLFAGGDGLLHVIDLRTEKELGKGFAGLKGDVICLAVNPKATHVLTATEDKVVTLWKLPTVQVPTLQAVSLFKGHKDKVTCLAFAPDGKHVVTGGDDATVRVWNLQGKEVAQSAEHKDAVRGVAFSPDGKTVVSCGDGIKLWEWQKCGQALAVPRTAKRWFPFPGGGHFIYSFHGTHPFGPPPPPAFVTTHCPAATCDIVAPNGVNTPRRWYESNSARTLFRGPRPRAAKQRQRCSA